MGPKKKEEQIDISSLPQCKSINAIIVCRGRKARAAAIQQRLQKECEKFMTRVKKSEVLDHAKEKNIYVDPSTLTDKQKKDPKFMETVNTEFTSEVVAKAVKSLLATLSVKVRLDKKNNPNQQEEKGRKYDMMYVFEDLPDTTGEFQELAKCGENVRYVLVLDPKISWANAPELPEENDEEEEDEEVKEYKQLLKKEEKTQEDIDHEAQIDKRVAHIRQLRSQSHRDSQFRNCTVSVLQSEIDPYNEEHSLQEIVRLFLESVNKLNADVVEFDEWRKERHAESMGEPVKVDHQPVQGNTILSLLDNLAYTFDEKSSNQAEAVSDEEQIMNLINGFSSTPAIRPLANSSVSSQPEKEELFVGCNEYTGENAGLLAEVRQRIRFPGINRFQMPDIPTKSERLRKLLQSQYALFLGKGMDLNQFLRRQQILNFEEYLKEFDEDRAYSFADRIYEEHHDKASLERELYGALELNEYSTFTKYDESTDKLYLMLAYKNNPRRVSKRAWESNWKVLPNYESWLKYFKTNEANLANTQFFDIDYEKIGSIEENTRCFTLPHGLTGAVIVNKDCTVSNAKQSLLYAMKDNFLFGVQSGKFFSENGQVRLYHLKNGGAYETVILLPQGRVRLVGDGNVLVEKDGRSRMVTPNGYSIIYGQEGSTILHPSGAVTYSHDTYTNQSGYGLKGGKLFSSPTLKRKVEGGEIIKRDDNTVIAHSLQNGEVSQSWVKFNDGTEYQVAKNRIRIEKEGEPFIICQNGNVLIKSDELTIRITNRADGYTTVVQFQDDNNLRIFNENVHVFRAEEAGEITVNLAKNQISSSFGNEQVRVGLEEAVYTKNGKKVDAREEEQRYGEDEALPVDYIEPRLFVISNDNTGVQLISEKMYQGYLKEHQSSIERIYEKKNSTCTECHLVAKEHKTNGKQIKSALSVNLDVFDNTQQTPQQPTHRFISLKSYLRYEPLTPAALAEMQRIKTELQAWRKQNAKEENEFGHREPNDPATKGKIEAKLLTIKKRQEREPRVKCESLRETARNFHLTAYEQVRKQLEKESREKQLRTQFMKKKNSIVQEYKKVNVSQSGRRNADPAEAVDDFMDHYFMTAEGRQALAEMPEWVFRPKEVKPPVELDPEIQNQLNNTNGLNREEEEGEEQRERYDTVEVNLVPKPEKEIYIKPSVFTQREIDEERSAFEQEKKAYKYHEAKRKDFNVYGQERKNRPEVRTLLRTQPISEINQKYLVTEAPLDKKVKIASMKNKLTSAASSMVEMRKEGPHTLLMKTIDKGYDINRLLEKRTMMVQADLNDKLQRDILINPTEANFGVITERRTYELKIEIKNEDVISQRITLRRPKSIHVKVQLSQMGPIAMGMLRQIIVTIRAAPEIIGKFTDEFDIVTKHEIYHIPILAHVVSEGQSKNESMALGRGVAEVEENPRKKNESSLELPRINK